MRTRYLALAVCFASLVCLAQQSDAPQLTATELLSRLRSNDGDVRDAALDRLRSDPAMLNLPVVRSALFDILDQNNKETDRAMREVEERERRHPTESDGEGDSEDEFFSWLVDTAASVADWNDPRQVCILVNSGSYLDGHSLEETAFHMKAAMPCILRRSRSDVNMNRAMAAEMLVRALAKSKSALDPETIQQARQLILSNLRDPDAGVRSFTVSGLDDAGEPDMIPALAEVARSDPAVEMTLDNKQRYPIREFAGEAITAIQERSAGKK
jgi:hypothetical protein